MKVKNPFRKSKKELPAIAVMAVGDDTEVLASLTSTLQAGGYIVYSVASVPAAVALLDEIEMPSVFIGDFRDPQAEGTEFMAKIGIRFGKSALPPVLFLMDSPEDEAAAKTLGVYDVLPKPLETEALLRSIRTISERKLIQ
ncbi:MAG: response regulator [Anaerolineae bacterium]